MIQENKERIAKELRISFFKYLENEFSFVFPFDVFHLADYLKIKLIDKGQSQIKDSSPLLAFLPLFSESYAFCGWNGDSPEIFYDSSIGSRENRYLIAHEICHILFPQMAGVRYVKKGLSEYHVRDATLSPIVDDILMPECLLRPMLSLPFVLSFDLFGVPMFDLLFRIVDKIIDRCVFMMILSSAGLQLVQIKLPHLKIFKQTYSFHKFDDKSNFKEENIDSSKYTVYVISDSNFQCFFLKERSFFYPLANALNIAPKMEYFVNSTAHDESNKFLSTSYPLKMSYNVDFKNINEECLEYPASGISFFNQDFMMFLFFLKRYETRFYDNSNYFAVLAVQDKDMKYYKAWLRGNESSILPNRKNVYTSKNFNVYKFIKDAPYKDIPLIRKYYFDKICGWESFYENQVYNNIVTDIYRKPS